MIEKLKKLKKRYDEVSKKYQESRKEYQKAKNEYKKALREELGPQIGLIGLRDEDERWRLDYR